MSKKYVTQDTIVKMEQEQNVEEENTTVQKEV